MEEKHPIIVERVVASIIEAERLSSEISSLEKPETAQQALWLLPEWDNTARQAVHFCRLACLVLDKDNLDCLIDLVHALDRDTDLWEQYSLAEWFGEQGDFPE